LNRFQPVFGAVGCVQYQHSREGLFQNAKKGNIAPLAILEEREVFARQVGHELAAAIRYGGGNLHQRRVQLEWFILRRFRCILRPNDGSCRSQHQAEQRDLLTNLQHMLTRLLNGGVKDYCNAKIRTTLITCYYASSPIASAITRTSSAAV